MHSTSRSSAGKRAWLRMLGCLERQPGYTYVSCDGSSSGWHACVVAAGEQLHLRARWADMQVFRQLSRCSTLRISRNLLGHAERRSRGERLRSGRHDPAARAGVLQPRSGAKRLSQRFGIRLQCCQRPPSPACVDICACQSLACRACKAVAHRESSSPRPPARRVMVRPARVSHINLRCSDATRCRFTMLNVCADALASLRQNVTATVPVSELPRLGGGGDAAR